MCPTAPYIESGNDEKFSINIRFSEKNGCLSMLDLGKISTCGDILESGCHLEIEVFFGS